MCVHPKYIDLFLAVEIGKGFHVVPMMTKPVESLVELMSLPLYDIVISLGVFNSTLQLVFNTSPDRNSKGLKPRRAQSSAATVR